VGPTTLTATVGITGTLTVTGDVISGTGSTQARLIANSSAASFSDVLYQTAGVARWAIEKTGAEGGSNAGGDLYFYRYSDAGGDLGNPLTITRSTGLVTANTSLSVTGTLGLGTNNPSTTVGIFGGTATTLGYSISPSGWNNAKHRLTVPTSGDTSVWSFNYNGSAVDFSGYNTSSISVGNGSVLIGTGAANTAPSTRFEIDVQGIAGFGTQGTTSDRLMDMSFQGAYTAGANQFGIVLNPTYPTTVTSSLFNLYTGPNLTAGTTVTNVYGLYLEGINAVGSTVTNRWGLYQASASDRNYFAGPVGVGTVTTSLGSINLAGSAALGISSGTTGDYLSSGGGNNSTYNGLAILSNSRAIATQANTGLPSWIVDIGGRAADGSTYNPNTANKFRVAYVAAGGSYYSASNFFAITSAGNVGVNNISPTTRFAVTLDEGQAASMTSFSPGTGAIGYNQGEIRECSFSVNNGANFVISSITTTATRWRVVFRGTWSNNFEGGGLTFYAPYIELNDANPSTVIGSRTLTVSRNGSGFLIVNSSDTYFISFAGTVEAYENPQSLQPEQSMRLLGGIQFPATQNTTSNANTLDDYEEGTWTPEVTVGGSTTGITYSARAGTYTKIGNTVRIDFIIRLTNRGSNTGDVSIGGLPFAKANNAVDFGHTYVGTLANMAALNSTPFGGIAGGSTAIAVRQLDSATSGSSDPQITHANISNSWIFGMSAVYAAAT
jgi:hypothetical protein